MKDQIVLIRKHLAVHMRIFTKKYLDTVPKKIACHMVEGMIGYINEKLFDDLASSDNLVSTEYTFPFRFHPVNFHLSFLLASARNQYFPYRYDESKNFADFHFLRK
jgi:Dynamin GTPase effector domain